MKYYLIYLKDGTVVNLRCFGSHDDRIRQYYVDSKKLRNQGCICKYDCIQYFNSFEEEN